MSCFETFSASSPACVRLSSSYCANDVPSSNGTHRFGSAIQ